MLEDVLVQHYGQSAPKGDPARFLLVPDHPRFQLKKKKPKKRTQLQRMLHRLQTMRIRVEWHEL